MSEQFTVRSIGSDSTMNRPAYEDDQELLKSRLAEGRYTLEEAAIAIGDAGESAEKMQTDLIEAAESGALSVHRPSMKNTYSPDVVRAWYAEAYWDDLNKWLGDTRKRIAFRFPAPSGAPENAEPPAPVATPARPIPAQRFQEQEILRVIGELGHDALKLPKDENGKDGVKAAVREALIN